MEVEENNVVPMEVDEEQSDAPAIEPIAEEDEEQIVQREAPEPEDGDVGK